MNLKKENEIELNLKEIDFKKIELKNRVNDVLSFIMVLIKCLISITYILEFSHPIKISTLSDLV